MSRAMIVVHSLIERERACLLVDKAPLGTRIEFKAPRRSLPQNDRMWAMLTDIARQIVWVDGRKYTTDDWKDYFMHALRKERWMPDEDGGYVPVGMRTSDLSKEEMGDLFIIIEKFAAQHGVVFSGEKEGAAA